MFSEVGRLSQRVNNVISRRLFLGTGLGLGAQDFSRLLTRSSLVIVDARPLARALDHIELELGIPVDYEDLWFLDRSNLVDTRLPRYRTDSNGSLPKELTFSIPRLENGVRDEAAVRWVLRQYSAADLPGTFRLLRRGVGVSVVCVAERVGQRNVPNDPILDTKISLTLRSEVGAKGLTAFVAALNQQAGSQVLSSGVVPTNFLFNTTVSLEFRNAPARTVLDALLRQLRPLHASVGTSMPTITWRLFRDTINNRFVLNLRIAEKLIASRDGPLIRVRQ